MSITICCELESNQLASQGLKQIPIEICVNFVNLNLCVYVCVCIFTQMYPYALNVGFISSLCVLSHIYIFEYFMTQPSALSLLFSPRHWPQPLLYPTLTQ